MKAQTTLVAHRNDHHHLSPPAKKLQRLAALMSRTGQLLTSDLRAILTTVEDCSSAPVKWWGISASE